MLTERYRERLYGALSCCDRIVIASTLPGIRYAAGMPSFLNSTMFSHSQKPLWSRRA